MPPPRAMSREDHDHDNDVAGDVSLASPNSMIFTSSIATDNSSTSPPKSKLAPHLFFLVGSSIQLFLSLCDLRDSRRDAQWDAEHLDWTDDDYGSSNNNTSNEGGNQGGNDDYGASGGSISANMYAVLYSMGPLLYLCNAFIDAKGALGKGGEPDNNCHDLRYGRNQFKQCIGLGNEATLRGRDQEGRREQGADEKLWELWVGCSFGLGAALELTSTLLPDLLGDSDGSQTAAARISVVSMHIYLLSGLLHLPDARKELQKLHHGDTGMQLAASTSFCASSSIVHFLSVSKTAMFIAGSFLDCTISYIYDPDLVSESALSEVSKAWCSLSSTLLWNICAIFCVIAECLHINRDDLGTGTTTSRCTCRSSFEMREQLPVEEHLPNGTVPMFSTRAEVVLGVPLLDGYVV